jgi:hypothetical protein
MKHTDNVKEQSETPQADKERASKTADAGAAPEQADTEQVATERSDESDKSTTPGKSDQTPDQDDELVDPREKRQDPPVPGQPKKIRVEN